MQLYPTRRSIELAVLAVLATVTAIITSSPAILAWSGALLVGLVLARAVTRVSITRIRLAGFEMLWGDAERLKRVGRGETLRLHAEIRNRDARAARFTGLRCVCSPHLSVRASPERGEVAAQGRFKVELVVHTPRIGRHGVHGISLELQGENGLFEVPLTFANPLGIEVLPRSIVTGLKSAKGGRSRLRAEAGLAVRGSGERGDLRELRDHQPGDPMRRIAWRASARRAKLMVRQYEPEERDIVWLLLDASVELWAGRSGEAPLDEAIDQVAATASWHLRRGDVVGLTIAASRTLAWLPPKRGSAQLAKIADALVTHTACYDVDRSYLTEGDVARRVYEHLKPLDPGVARLKSRDLGRLLKRAEKALGRAPFKAEGPYAATVRERTLRRYLASFGVYAPSRVEPDRPKTDVCTGMLLKRIQAARPRATLLYVWSPAPSFERQPELQKALKSLSRRIELRWVSLRLDGGLAASGTTLAGPVADALGLRLEVARQHGERAVRRLGFRVQPLVTPRLAPAPSEGVDLSAEPVPDDGVQGPEQALP